MDEMIKKLLTAILVVLIINTVFVATLLFNGNKAESVTTSTDESEEETTEYDTSKMESIDYNKFKDLMNSDEKSIVLFARSTCGYCVKFMPILNEAITKNNLKVYYLDVTTMSSDDINDVKSLEPFADAFTLSGSESLENLGEVSVGSWPFTNNSVFFNPSGVNSEGSIGVGHSSSIVTLDTLAGITNVSLDVNIPRPTAWNNLSCCPLLNKL